MSIIAQITEMATTLQSLASSSAPSPYDQVEMSIELLPEFGWSIQGRPVFGPGSVFQGSVRVSLDRQRLVQASFLRLQFVASEGMKSYEQSPGVIQRRNSLQLFGIQHILWKGELLDESTYAFPFTIQMPLVQFPPSMDNEYYHCTFQLKAILERHNGQTATTAQKTMIYMPFTETCALKTPLVQRQTAGFTLKLHALDYVPGDPIRVIMGGLRQGRRTAVTLQLIQTTMALQEQDRPKLRKVVASSKRSVSSSSSSSTQEEEEQLVIELPLAVDLVPTLNYSPVLSVSYHLRAVVEQKKGPLGGLWCAVASFELPITLGTLGYGMGAPEGFQLYTALTHEARMPRFMRVIEYTDSLPLYDPVRLPSYDTAVASTL